VTPLAVADIEDFRGCGWYWGLPGYGCGWFEDCQGTDIGDCQRTSVTSIEDCNDNLRCWFCAGIQYDGCNIFKPGMKLQAKLSITNSIYLNKGWKYKKSCLLLAQQHANDLVYPSAPSARLCSSSLPVRWTLEDLQLLGNLYLLFGFRLHSYTNTGWTLGVTMLKRNAFNTNQTPASAKKTPSLQLNLLNLWREYSAGAQSR